MRNKKTSDYKNSSVEAREQHIQNIKKDFEDKKQQLYRDMDEEDEANLCIMWAWVTQKYPHNVDTWLDLWLGESAHAYESANSGSCDAGFTERISMAARGLGDEQIAEMVRPAEELLTLKMKAKNLEGNPNIPDNQKQWITLLVQLGGANNLEGAQQKVADWWEGERTFATDHIRLYKRCDQSWINTMDGATVAAMLENLEENQVQGFLDAIKPVVTQQETTASPQPEDPMEEIRRQQQARFLAQRNQQQPAVTSTTTSQTQSNPTVTFYNAPLFYHRLDRIDLAALEQIYATYSSLNTDQPFNEWMRSNTLTNNVEAFAVLQQEYENIPRNERDICTFYEFLRLQTTIIEDQENGTPVVSVGLNLLERLSTHWQSHNMHFDQWFKRVIAPQASILPILNKVRLAYGNLDNLDCFFYDFLLFYAAFQWDDSTNGGEVRVDFTVLEHLLNRWTNNTAYQTDDAVFENWLVKLSTFNNNLHQKFSTHWMPYYTTYYKAHYPTENFIEFLKYQQRYETDRDAQVERDSLYAQFLQN